MLSALLTVILTFTAAFILFSITVFVHELGHFLAARWRGLVVEEFAIGMGKKVWGFRWGGVECNLRAFPFGGFVKLPQMVAMEVVEGQTQQDIDALPPISPLSKIITAFAGPLFSFFLAVFFAILCYLIGIPQNQAMLTKVVGYVEPNSPAQQAGILAGDEIVTIDDRSVSRWAGRYDGVAESIMLAKNELVKVDILRAGLPMSFSVLPVKDPKMENLRTIGIENYPTHVAEIGTVHPNSPAASAGMRKGDVIIEINGQKVTSPGQVTYLMNKQEGLSAIVVKRGEEILNISIKPLFEKTTQRYLLGINWNMSDPKTVHLSPVDQIVNGVFTIQRTFEALASPKSGVGLRHLSGPVGIFDKLMNLLTVDWRLVLYFSVILNVNLAIMNLLPIPILDGGHIVLSVIEWIRRKPAEQKIIEILHMASFGLLISFFLYVTFFDISRSGKRAKNFFEGGNKDNTTLQFEQPAPAKK